MYALPFYSVEAIYFHPKIMERIAARQAGVSGEDASALIKKALAAGVDAISNQTERLSQKVVKKSVRKLIIEQIPNDDELLAGQPVILQNDATVILATRKSELDNAVAIRDLGDSPDKKLGARVGIVGRDCKGSGLPQKAGLRESSSASSHNR